MEMHIITNFPLVPVEKRRFPGVRDHNARRSGLLFLACGTLVAVDSVGWEMSCGGGRADKPVAVGCEMSEDIGRVTARGSDTGEAR